MTTSPRQTISPISPARPACRRRAAPRRPRPNARSRPTRGSRRRRHMVGPAQARDGHRRLALAVELHEDRAERRHRLLQAVHVHRAAAVDDRPQIGGHGRPVCTSRCTIVGARNALQPGWCSQRSRNSSGSNAADSESPAARRATRTAGCRGRSRATSAPRAPGCSLVGRVEIREMGHGHRHQVAVREHRAFRAPGCAAGVEQPRQGHGSVTRGGSAAMPVIRAEYVAESTVSTGTSVTD